VPKEELRVREWVPALAIVVAAVMVGAGLWMIFSLK
jgi:hypothetical protein